MNLKLLNSLEKDIGVALSSVSYNTFIEKFTNKKLAQKYFIDRRHVQDILEYLVTNPNLKVFTDSMSLFLRLNTCEEEIDQIYTRYLEDKNRPNLIKAMLTKVESNDAVEVISAALCMMISLEDTNIEIYYNTVSRSYTELIKHLEQIPISKETYQLQCDLLDLLLEMCYYWNSKYENKIKEELLDEKLKKLHTFEFEEFEGSTTPSLDMTPEDIGLLDITRIGGEI